MQSTLVRLQLIHRRRQGEAGVEAVQLASECRQRVSTRTQHQDPPADSCGAACPQTRQQAGTDEGRLSTTRGTDDGDETAALQLLDEALNIGLPTEVVASMPLVESIESLIRGRALLLFRPNIRTEGDTVHRIDQVLQATLGLRTVPEVHPGAGGEERREVGGLERLQTWQQHRKQPERSLGGGAVQRHGHLEPGPGTEVARADEDGTG